MTTSNNQGDRMLSLDILSRIWLSGLRIDSFKPLATLRYRYEQLEKDLGPNGSDTMDR